MLFEILRGEAEARWLTARQPDGPLSLFGLAIVAATVVVDQAAKPWSRRSCRRRSIDVLPILALYRVSNTGSPSACFAVSAVSA